VAAGDRDGANRVKRTAEEECAERRRLLRFGGIWHVLPRAMRPFYLAQRARCMLCGKRLSLYGAWGHKGEARLQATTWEHVTPRARSKGRSRNKTLTHLHCNTRKGDRMPFACELLFLEFTNEIVEDLK
jgi:hypothetical protein